MISSSNNHLDLDRHIWISASAGSGKTKTLVDRFLRLLLDRVEPKKILCITFTNAAAAEMIHRITKELGKWATCTEYELSDKIYELTGAYPGSTQIDFARKLFLHCLEEQNKLQIQTIHSFAQSLLSKFPIEAGISTEMQLMDDQQKKLFTEQAKLSFLSKSFHKKGDVLANSSGTLEGSLIHLLSNIHDSTLDTLISSVFFLKNTAYDTLFTQSKEELVSKIESHLNLKEIESPESVLRTIRAIFIEYKGSVDFEDEELSDVDIVKSILSFVSISSMDFHQELSDFKSLFLTQTGGRRVTLLKSNIKKKHPEALEMLSQMQELIFSYEENIKSHEIFKFTSGFVDFALEFDKLFTEQKLNSEFIDYDDIINLSLRLIKDSEISQWVKYKINNQLSHIMIDEAQDTNLKQWQIIHSCIEDFCYSDSPQNLKTLFVVGDAKQAIYSFQGSSPDLFRAMHVFLKNNGFEINDIRLSKSFRSDQKILDFVNEVFNIVHSKNAQYISEPNVPHFSSISSANSEVDIWPLVVREESDEETPSAWEAKFEYKSYINVHTILAEQIANHIEDLLKKTEYFPSDIMILVRKRDDLIKQIAKALKNKNIPTNGLDRLNLSENLAIQDLLSIAKFILLPSDDYNLACLLKSPVIALSEEKLFILSQRGDLSLWDNLKKHNDAFSSAYAFLNGLLNKHEIHSHYVLFEYVLDAMKLRSKFLSRFGMQINEVLNEFINISVESRKNISSLSEFVHYFENSNIEIKTTLDPTKNEIKLMTVHASKGLESKVVILPDTVSIPKATESILIDRDSEIILYNGNRKNNNLIYSELLSKTKNKTLQEYYRLLYVALTRASQKLIICGCSNKESINQDSWYSICKSAISGRSRYF